MTRKSWFAAAAVAVVHLFPCIVTAQTNSTTVDYLVVTPGFECTRITPGGIDEHTAQFIATGWNSGPNAVAQSQSGDDINLGSVPVTWGVGNSVFDSRSGQHALTESPSGTYGNNWVVTATTTAPIDLSGAGLASLEFWHHHSIEANFDFALVQINAGSGWATVAAYNGEAGAIGDFQYSWINLADYVGQTIQVRFRVGTNSSVTFDGWVIDDVVVRKDSTVMLEDDFESGLGNWTISAEWGLTIPGAANDYGSISPGGLFTAGTQTGSTFVRALYGETIEATALVDVYPPDWVP